MSVRIANSLTNQFIDYRRVIFSDESIIRLRDTQTMAWINSNRIPTRPQPNKSNGGIMV